MSAATFVKCIEIIAIMNRTNLANVDLNLLIVFDAIARTRSVTLAANALSLSQPAVSHALRRLRLLMQDPLFVRGRDGLVATPHATALVSDVQAILAAIDRVLTRPEFDPGSTTREYRLAGSDYAMMTLFPAIVASVRRHAPHSNIRVSSVDATTPSRMEAGSVDLAFFGVAVPSGPFASVELFREHFVGLVCRGHPIARKARRGRITLDDFLKHPHVLASIPNAKPSPIDTRLAELGRQRRVALVAPNFAANVAAVHGSDLLLSLPSRLAALPLCHGLVSFKLPIAMLDYPYLMTWHRSTEHDPAAAWLRKLVIDAAKSAQSIRSAR